MISIANKLTFLATGILYGFGFALSGFTDPESMRAFLRLAHLWEGTWNAAPALALAAALFVAMIGIRLGQHMKRPIFNSSFHWPYGGVVDGRMFFGALIFGVGWGLSGFVPISALAALLILPYDATLFLIGAAIGIVLVDLATLGSGHAPKGA